MAGSTPIYGFPYPQPSDLVANYPALGQQLAEDVETEIAASSIVRKVVQTVDTTARSTTSTSFVSTSISATITPSSTSNKILIQASGIIGYATGMRVEFTIYNGASDINATGKSALHSVAETDTATGSLGTLNLNYLYSPATTSATTLTLYWRADSANTAYLGRNNANSSTAPTILTLWEVAP
jgi:hypothetical protein